MNLKQFVRDKELKEMVRQVLLEEFLKEGSTTVNELAAEKLAINKLNKAFKNLERLNVEKSQIIKDKPLGL